MNLFLSELSLCELRGTAGAPFLNVHVHGREVLADRRGVHVLREKIRRILSSGHLIKLELLRAKLVLYPEVGHVQMTDAAEPLSSRNTNCSGSIIPQVQVEAQAEILGNALQAYCVRGCSDEAGQLSLGGTESDRCLSCRPRLQAVPPLITTPPDVLRRVRRHPAKSVSAYTLSTFRSTPPHA